MNFVAIAIVSVLFLATRSTKESSFDWLKLHSLCLNNNSQIATKDHGKSQTISGLHLMRKIFA